MTNYTLQYLHIKWFVKEFNFIQIFSFISNLAVKSNAFIEQAPESVDKLKFVAALCCFWWTSFLTLGAMLDLLKFLQMLHVVLLATEISIFYSLAFTKTLGMLCTVVS